MRKINITKVLIASALSVFATQNVMANIFMPEQCEAIENSGVYSSHQDPSDYHAMQLHTNKKVILGDISFSGMLGFDYSSTSGEVKGAPIRFQIVKGEMGTAGYNVPTGEVIEDLGTFTNTQAPETLQTFHSSAVIDADTTFFLKLIPEPTQNTPYTNIYTFSGNGTCVCSTTNCSEDGDIQLGGDLLPQSPTSRIAIMRHFKYTFDTTIMWGDTYFRDLSVEYNEYVAPQELVKVTGLTVNKNAGNHVYFHWDAQEIATHYQGVLFVKLKKGWKRLWIRNIDASDYTIKLRKNKLYKFRVRAVDSENNKSVWSSFTIFKPSEL